MLNDDVQSEPELQLVSTEPIWRHNYYELIIYLSYCLVNQVLELHTSGEVSAGIKGEGLHLATNHYLYFIDYHQDNHLRFECHRQLYLCILSH